MSNTSILTFGWNSSSEGNDIFKELSDEFKQSKEFESCSDEFKDYVNTADDLVYSGMKTDVMDKMFEESGLENNPFHNVETLLDDSLHFHTDSLYGISSTIANINEEELLGYKDSFGLRNVIHTTNPKLNKTIQSVKEFTQDELLLEIYLRKERGNCGVDYGTQI